MADPQFPVEDRLTNMMRFLMGHHANVEDPPPATPRGVVSLADALDAILQIGFVLDEQMESGAIPRMRGLHAGAMLMVVRDFIEPLPDMSEGAASDPVTRDLRVMVDRLRSIHAPDTLPPDWT